MTRTAIPPPITTVIEAAGMWLPRRLGVVERRLTEVAAGHGAPLADDAVATLSAGGKRLRPLLVLLCAGEEASDAAIRAATAIELVHMATLVHDDVLDGAEIRRGEPTVVARSGRGRAVAVGDLLLSRAFAELSAPGGERQVELLSEASVALARGELAQRRDAFDLEVGVERYLERCRLKTAALFECACVIGRAGGAGSPDGGPEAALASFGREIGLAFQLLDDALDVEGPAERIGKPRGTDLLDGTVNLPLIVARGRDSSLAALELRGLDPAAAERICDRIVATGATDEVRSRATARVADAKRALAAAPLPGSERDLLHLVADGVVDRYS